MNEKTKVFKNLPIVKTCAFCGKFFYAKKKTAVYCSDSCKVKFNKRKNTIPQWYTHDPNVGKKLPPGTVTSWEMSEDQLIFSGDVISLVNKLAAFVTLEQLFEERKRIKKLQPYSKTHNWFDSSVQISSDIHFMEIFRILPKVYKFYCWSESEAIKEPFL